MYCYQCMSPMQGERCPQCGFVPRRYQPIPTALPPESVLAGKYQVGCVLGKGGFGITYIGRIISSGQVVAVKEYFPSVFATRDSAQSKRIRISSGARDNFEKGVRRFYEEAETLSRLRSIPAIVQVYDFFYENGTAYIVMEYIKGQTVENLVKQRGRLDLPLVLTIFYPIMEALHAVHQTGLLHRDVSPCNIILDKHFQPRLIDFGAARAFSGQLSSDMSVILKKGFAPLEQYTEHGRHGPAEDIYGLSASIYYALTGRVPPASTDRVIFDTLQPLAAHGASVSPQFEQILMRGLAVHFTDRYAGMDEMCRAIDQLLLAPTPEAILRAPEPVGVNRPLQKQIHPIIWPCAIGAVGMLILVVLLLLTK